MNGESRPGSKAGDSLPASSHAASREPNPAGESPSIGLYISIPFCRSKCTYCNFSSGVYPAGEHARYVDRLIADLRGADAWAQKTGVELPRRVDSIYLGGGTPSLLEPGLLARLFAAIRGEFAVEADAEITMECAPGQLAEATLAALPACGVNRVSLGAQSFVDREAHASGRLHSRAIIETDLRRLRGAGIANLNIDLIAGLAHQTLGSWDESLAALLGCGAPHASVYMLEVDEDSRLGRELLDGGVRYGAGLVPGDETIARMYERACERLGDAGLAQYEISNFSRPAWQSRHNLRYWQRRPYLGVGLDASSALYAAASVPDELPWVQRSSTTGELDTYLSGPQPAETAWLSPQRQFEEAWFLGLRLNAGVREAALEYEFGRAMVEPALEVANRLIADGLLRVEDDAFCLTPRGRLLSNEVFQQFLEQNQGSCSLGQL